MTKQKKSLLLTKAAAQRIKHLMEKAPEGCVGLRIGVDQKGCSGLAYQVTYINTPTAADLKITAHNATVYVAPEAALVLYGATMDYVEEDLYQGFRFDNPNAKGTCGCGESFHI